MAAPESSTSSSSRPSAAPSSSADSYIGSLISLTSKSEIRYEGILYNINTNESSIGLRNVRSFGTEGRKKEGPQIPASDKIYEYILFRGSDIKDLQVKSSPPQPTPIHNDPAIIQSHYPRAASTTTSMPSVGSGTLPDLSSHTTQMGLPRSTFQGSLPMYQPGAGLAPWGSSTPAAANGSGLAVPPMYWQYYAPSGGLPQMQQPPLLRPPGLTVPQGMQQPLQYPGLNSSLPSASQNLPDFSSPLFPPAGSSPNLTSSSLPSSLAPPSSSLLAQETSTLLPMKSSVTTLPTSTITASLPLVPPLTTTNIDPVMSMAQNTPSVVGKPSTVTGPTVQYQSAPSSLSSVAVTSSSSQVETSPLLVTPGQLLPIGPAKLSSSQPLHASHKDADVRTLEDKTKPILPAPTTNIPAEIKEPILPLPKPIIQKPTGTASYTQYNRGRGRGRGNGYSRTVTKFTEDFDFTAMNEKFNKDEVWGHLGKSKAQELEDEYDDIPEEDDDTQKVDVKPVYVKDDFFDSLSCGTIDRGSQNGRTKFSEQLKLDAETFGDSARHRQNRGGGRGFRGGGRSRGSFYGRGYGYGGRGRGGHYMSNRPL